MECVEFEPVRDEVVPQLREALTAGKNLYFYWYDDDGRQIWRIRDHKQLDRHVRIMKRRQARSENVIVRFHIFDPVDPAETGELDRCIAAHL